MWFRWLLACGWVLWVLVVCGGFWCVGVVVGWVVGLGWVGGFLGSLYGWVGSWVGGGWGGGWVPCVRDAAWCGVGNHVPPRR